MIPKEMVGTFLWLYGVSGPRIKPEARGSEQRKRGEGTGKEREKERGRKLMTLCEFWYSYILETHLTFGNLVTHKLIQGLPRWH